MKHFVNIAKLLLTYMVITIAVIFVFEMSRMRETKSTMIMFSRIAGNYALTASQDVGELTNSNYAGRVVCMYDKNEYKPYLDALQAAAIDTNDKSLLFASTLLLADYDRAVSMAYGSANLDPYLKYTPMSFNLPYISERMLKDCYTEAMLQMIANYKCQGRPSVFAPLSSGNGFNMSTSSDIAKVSATGAYGGGDTISFDCVEMTPELMMSIYGSEDYYDSKLKDIFSNLDATLYNDPRFAMFMQDGADGFDSSMVHIPMYRIHFETPYFYITRSDVLSFGRQKLFFGTDNAIADALANGTDVNVYRNASIKSNMEHAGFNVSGNYFKDTFIPQGQLMFHLDNFVASSDFEYTLLS